MPNRYSRQQRFETRRDARSAIIYIGLTIVAILAILFFGIPLIGKVAGFLHDLRSSGSPIDVNDTTPPAPPFLEPLPESTNLTNLEINGRTESGARVKLFVNGSEEETIADSSGSFSYDWVLWKGENKISAKVTDTAGNESTETDVYQVAFDATPPDLEITNPQNGQTFSGTKQRQITIEGKTEVRARLTINDRIVAVDSDGGFSFFTTLVDGENKFTLKSKDYAGNEAEKAVSVNFTP